MGAYLSKLIDQKIDELDCSAALKQILHILREYTEIQSGTWNEIMEEKIKQRDLKLSPKDKT